MNQTFLQLFTSYFFVYKVLKVMENMCKEIMFLRNTAFFDTSCLKKQLLAQFFLNNFQLNNQNNNQQQNNDYAGSCL